MCSVLNIYLCKQRIYRIHDTTRHIYGTLGTSIYIARKKIFYYENYKYIWDHYYLFMLFSITMLHG